MSQIFSTKYYSNKANLAFASSCKVELKMCEFYLFWSVDKEQLVFSQNGGKNSWILLLVSRKSPGGGRWCEEEKVLMAYIGMAITLYRIQSCITTYVESIEISIPKESKVVEMASITRNSQVFDPKCGIMGQKI